MPTDGTSMRLPRVLASSVVRGAQFGESHGGLYLVDLHTGSAEPKLDWSRADIDFQGRGGDRGLRGIAFYGERILVAANAELLVLDLRFRLIESHRHPYLAHCHEISVSGARVYLTSTQFDSLLVANSCGEDSSPMARVRSEIICSTSTRSQRDHRKSISAGSTRPGC